MQLLKWLIFRVYQNFRLKDTHSKVCRRILDVPSGRRIEMWLRMTACIPHKISAGVLEFGNCSNCVRDSR